MVTQSDKRAAGLKWDRMRTRQDRFLTAFSNCGDVKKASRCAQVPRDSHYRWLTVDPTYVPRFKKAKDLAIQRLEDELVERTVEGEKRPVLYKGKPVHVNGEILYEYEKSDRLLMFLLESLAPEKYKRRAENTMVWDGRLDSIPKEQLPTVIDNLMRQAFGDDPAALEAGRQQVMREAGVQIVNGEFVAIGSSH